MNVLQSILDFILSFLKLSTNKILIGLLSIGLGVSIYQVIILNEKHNEELRTIKKEYKAETDTLRSMILKMTIDHSKRETQLMKECFEQKENLSKEMDREIKNLKRG